MSCQNLNPQGNNELEVWCACQIFEVILLFQAQENTHTLHLGTARHY